ncbi:MAG: HAMP domain-containing sensor histidine kinase [Sulfurimonas sp.]|jgi:C4-dicarboxylate-specific signal transduction histidine kinase|nr:HAMP domain-containing sensor histidine kinase [Sulfurimonas sp.]
MLVSLKKKVPIVFEVLLLAFLFVLLALFFFIYKNHKLKTQCHALEKKIEQELQETQMKTRILHHQNKLISMSEMMENIAHQWRQPLSQINSAVLVIDDLLYEKEVKDSVIEEKLLEVESLTKYMSKTIDDFKDFFNQNKAKEHFNLQNLIEKSIYIVRGTLKSHNIEIQSEITKSIQCYGYPSELQQVVVVILNNAKDMFLSRNIFRPKIQIDVEQKEQEIQINICDNGGGIDESIREKIFEPYFTTKHKSQGTGLGLYISKMIIEESMEGSLEVSVNKYGACFHIRIKGRYE